MVVKYVTLCEAGRKLDGDREEAFASSVTCIGGRRRMSDWEDNLLLPVRQGLAPPPSPTVAGVRQCWRRTTQPR
jgi:hypothetical protein